MKLRLLIIVLFPTVLIQAGHFDLPIAFELKLSLENINGKVLDTKCTFAPQPIEPAAEAHIGRSVTFLYSHVVGRIFSGFILLITKNVESIKVVLLTVQFTVIALTLFILQAVQIVDSLMMQLFVSISKVSLFPLS